MSQEQKAALEGDALTFISGAKGVSRSEVAEKLGLDPSKAATVLRALKEAGKIKSEGEKSQTKWFAK